MPDDPADRLDSWKEIAAHLGREVRTVQGWEKNEGLPIHRHQHAKQGSVYAFRSELDAWRKARKGSPESPTPRRRWPIAVAAAVAILAAAGFFVWRKQASANTVTSIAVLPFVDFSPQHDQEYFSDGLTEEVIDALSRVPNLHVVARTSAFAFKGKANDIRQIGKQLQVEAVLEGSVRKDGDRLRITAQLNRVSDGMHIWSQKYDRELRDVFVVQQEISQSIAAKLRAGDVPAQHRGTTDVQAYQDYQEARFFFNQQEPASYHKAIERFQKAIDRDPNFALAYAGMADSWAYLAENFVEPPRDVMPKARAAAERAAALDPWLAEGHISRGIVKLDYEWDREGAQAEFQRALQLNPGSMWAHHWYAHSRETQRRLPEAMKEMTAALALDPLSLILYWDVGYELLIAGRNQDALDLLKKGDELFPNFWLLNMEQAEAYHALHNDQAVGRVVEKMKSSNPEMKDFPPFMAIIGTLAAYAGQRQEAAQILDRLDELSRAQYVEPFMTSGLAAALGDHARLKVWLDRIVENRSPMYLYAPLSTSYFAEQPEVREFMERVANATPPAP
jgi:TolB-like protein